MMIMSEGARACALTALGAAPGGFARDWRFSVATERPEPAPPPPPDPVEQAYAQGYADGSAAAQAAAQAQAAADDAARARIEDGLARIAADHADQFAQALTDTVLALCDAVLAEAAIAPDALVRRATRAAALFARAGETRVIRLHPEDLALIHARLPETWHCEPDPALERGALRIETDAGGVDDGPDQWRAALAATVREC